MEKTTQPITLPELAELLTQGQQALTEGRALLVKEGKAYDTADWVTIKEYTKRFNIESTEVVSNWIRRGIVPPENILVVEEFNNIRLIKAIPYREA